MNPIIENRYRLLRRVVFWALFAALYALVFVLWGVVADELPVARDGVVFSIVAGFLAILLWNGLKYVVSMNSIPLFAALIAWFVPWRSPAGDFDKSPEEETGRESDSLSEPPSDGEGLPALSKEASETPPGDDAGKPIERITVRGGQGAIEVIAVERIVCLQAEGDYVAIVTESGRWLKEQTMRYFEERLPNGKFVRVHRSCIVSVSHISRIETSGREHTLVLRGMGGATGGTDDVSGRRRGGGNPGGNPRGTTSIRISDAGYKLLRATLGL